MAFGRNPHVTKAQAAELKAAEAPDAIARAMAHRDAAHQWERAADREKPGKYKLVYEANAQRNRDLAEAERAPRHDALAKESELAGEAPDEILTATDAPPNAHALEAVSANPKLWN